jgi:predicted GTPase
MTKVRIIVLLLMATLPIVFLSGVGAYYLWETGWAFYAWWPMALCLGGSYFLAWRWQKQHRKEQHEAPPPMHWTERDKEAWKLVEGRVAVADKVPEDQFALARFYFDVGQEMAHELAKIYRPDATDPIGLVTVPEILSVIELATHDLNELTQKYVPGSHMLTIDNVRSARKALKWYRMGTNVYWAASALFDPLKTATRFVAAKYGMGKPLEMFQQNVILWFYAAYVRKVGEYLIELYSGRLKVGTARYRDLKRTYTGAEQANVPTATPHEEQPAQAPPSVSVALVGQVKAGKSSLINALLGEQRAATDVVPLTTGVTRYELHAPELSAQLGLLDSQGYSHAGASADNVKLTAEAVQNCDLLILVLHARNSGRKADVDFLAQLREWFRERPHLKMPPLLVTLTHIDLLTPAMEWSPPYDRFAGTRTKEKSMAEAVTAVREVFPEAAGVVVCRAEEGKLWGIDEEVMPAVVDLLGEAKAVAFLRCVHAEADEGKVKRIFQQLWTVSKKAYQMARGQS